MGRYYNGDINGKFWFAVQPSNSADRFGVTGQVPNYLEYYFTEEDKPNVEKELNRIKDSLGEQLHKMDEFFDKHSYYTDAMLNSEGIDVSKLRDYTDYKLGKQILDCLEEEGYCDFTAEL